MSQLEQYFYHITADKYIYYTDINKNARNTGQYLQNACLSHFCN